MKIFNSRLLPQNLKSSIINVLITNQQEQKGLSCLMDGQFVINVFYSYILFLFYWTLVRTHGIAIYSLRGFPLGQFIFGLYEL